MRRIERAEQVMLMCEIYSKADQTLVWLGDSPEQLRAFDFVEDILEAYESVLEKRSPVAVKDGSSLLRLLDMLEEPLPDHHDLSARHAYQARAIELLGSSGIFNEPIQQTTESLADMIKTADGIRKFRAFASLENCPYWQRSWVWQEITVSMEPVLVCGSKRTSLMDYILAFRIFHAFFNSKNFIGLTAEEGTPIPNEPRISLSQSYADAKPVILHMIRQVWWNSSLTLRQVLTFSRQLKSTDPRDKIYGILSMVSEAYHISPDYRASMTPNRLFLLATIRSILVDDNLDILSDGQETNRSYTSQRALPSWVPDFSVFNRRKPSIPAISPEEEKLSLFRATLDTKPSASFIDSDKLGPSTVLRLSGICLGSPLDAKNLGAVSGRGAVQKWIDFLIQQCPDASKVCLPTGPDEFIMQSLFRSVMFGMELHDLAPLIGQDDIVDTKFVRQSFVVDTFVKNMAQLEELEEWRFFFIKADDIMGMVPAKAAPNDRIVFFLGSKVPFVVRQSVTGYELVGPCYVHGYMHGRILNEQNAVQEVFDIH
ncbi:Folylpolyglutamate synthetase [Neophaeococcomyces mojaviensis]|uniref:Folylpolyglutamate synthetase n=1 Tax=Neophaeococcomyces mojaviensis TaxID=3383035 RepID=A0ACC3A4M6_9EURO|nr:Folylpolyglutamate synthetase [Knufia sp. JES_112]